MPNMRVTHRQIEAFRALMLCESMTEAAHSLSVTQPAVSKIVSQLEEELGFPLFNRRQGKFSPTDNAFILFAEVKQSYSGLERVMRAARRIKSRTGGNLRLTVFPSLATGFIVQVVRRIYESGNNMQLTLQAHGSEEVADLVASGLYDLGFATTPVHSTRVQVGPVMSVPSFCILPPHHRLAERNEISVLDLEGETFIATAEGTASRLRTDALFTSMNISRNIMIEARWSLTISDLVHVGLGCSIVDGFSAFAFANRGGIVRPLLEKLDFTFVSITPHSPTASSTLENFHEAFDHEFDVFHACLVQGDFAAP